MIAETRLERFIMEAADKSPETTPITRIETYLSDIANDRVSTLPPISRIELYLAKISGADVQIPRPILRIEMYLAALAGMDIEVPTPVTREEYLLSYWLENQGGEVVLIEGAAPLTLAGALAYAIHSLTQYGLCTQASTPTPSAPVDIMCNNGALKVRRQSGLPLGYQKVEWLKSAGAITITGFKTKSTQEIETVFYRESRGQSYLYYSDSATSGTTNTTAYISTSGANWRWDGKSANINPTTGIRITSIQNEDGVWLNGTKAGSYSSAGGFVSTSDLRLSSNENTTVRIYSMTIREGDTVTLDLVPVQRLSDSAYGFYDKVSGNFHTNAEATFEAGAVIDDPVEVYTDGTPEVLTVSGKNIYNVSANPIEQGSISSSTGQNMAATSRVRTSGYTPVKPNTTYTISATIEGYTPGASKGVFLYQYNADASEWTSSGWQDANGYTFTTGATTAKIRAVFAKAGSGSTTPDMVSNVQVQEGSTVTAYEPYVAPQTATVDDLLAVGDYKDTHDIISGSIARNVGVILYDGSEDESWSRLGTNAFAVTNSVKKVGKYTMLCSHYTYTAATSANCSSGEFGCSSGTPRTIYFKNELYDTVDDWRAALAADPIIVIYPLATPTTEQGTAQHLHTTAGTNVVDVSANVGPVELSVEYMA